MVGGIPTPGHTQPPGHMPLDISTRCQHTHHIPPSGIWWSSLQICSNLFNWGPTPWPVLTSSDGHQSGQYASYWNAFLYNYIYSFPNIKTTLGIYSFTPTKDTGNIHSKTLSWVHNFPGLLASFLKHSHWQKTLSTQSSSAIHHICHRCPCGPLHSGE